MAGFDGRGYDPKWSRTRPELLYAATDQKIMVVPYTVEGDSFRPGKPTRWSDAGFVRRPLLLGNFDPHPDGQRLALDGSQTPEEPADTVVFITNFFDELCRLTAADRQ